MNYQLEVELRLFIEYVCVELLLHCVVLRVLNVDNQTHYNDSNLSIGGCAMGYRAFVPHSKGWVLESKSRQT